MSTFAKMPGWGNLVTNVAKRSGAASDPTIWEQPLADGQWLGIDSGLTVTWDLQNCPALGGIYSAGVLDAGQAPGDLVINVGTLVNDMGQLLIGDCMSDRPLQANSLSINFLPAPLDSTVDPGRFSVGLLSMGGHVNLCGGVDKTAFVRLAPAKKGDLTLTCLTAPIGWEPGDELLIPGLVFSPIMDEVIKLAMVQGNIVTLQQPLAFDHVPPSADRTACLANLSRRIKFCSASPAAYRGHVMLMRDANGMATMVEACHAEIVDCGRTDASRPVTDPVVDSNGVLVPGTDDNPRARYAWHEHRQGQDHPATNWDTLVVRGFKKWAFDNHDSNVNASGLVAYDGQGACFATERGSEVGCYNNCLGVRTSGVSGLEFARGNVEDFGWTGSGIWFQGPGVTATGNVLCGHPVGVYVFTPGASRVGKDGSTVLAQTFSRSLLPANFTLKNPNADPMLVQVPYFGIDSNESIGCNAGYICDWNQTDAPNVFTSLIPTTIKNPVTYNCPTGILINHISPAEVVLPVLLGPAYAVGTVGLSAVAYVDSITVSNPTVSGFETGLTTACNTNVSDGTWSNVWDYVDLVLPHTQEFVVAFSGSPSFIAVPQTSLAGRTALNFKIAPYQRMFFGLHNTTNPNDYFYPVTYYLPNNLEIFKNEQAADFVPYPSGDPNVPPMIVGLTNAQLQAQYGICVGDKVAGSPVGSPYTTNGIISIAQPTRNYYVFGGGAPTSALITTTPTYVLSVYDYRHAASYTDTTPVALASGWNALTRIINGQTYTFFVLNNGTPVQPKATTTTVSASDHIVLALQANVASGANVSEGVVQFIVSQGATQVGSVQAPVSGGIAVASMPVPGSGTYTVQTNYSGSANFQPSSGSTQIVV